MKATHLSGSLTESGSDGWLFLGIAPRLPLLIVSKSADDLDLRGIILNALNDRIPGLIVIARGIRGPHYGRGVFRNDASADQIGACWTGC